MRRAVEPEAARYAALRATDEERDAIRGVADSDIHHVMDGTDHAAAAIAFHRLVARASHNKMLTAVASLTLDPSNNALSTLLDAISVKAGAHFTFAHEHRDIVNAIVAREPHQAETAMREHVDDLIKVVQHYRARTPVLRTAVRFMVPSERSKRTPALVR
jgi:GntR family transcriptional regulator, transcriptional repressor for pyruvate dehydrogenase complex